MKTLLKETISEMVDENIEKKISNQDNIFDKFVGKYVICRTRNEGVNCGRVKELDETGVVLTEARRMWYHNSCDDSCWYEGIAKNGISDDSRLSTKSTKLIVEDYSLTLCSEKAERMLSEKEDYTK